MSRTCGAPLFRIVEELTCELSHCELRQVTADRFPLRAQFALEVISPGSSIRALREGFRRGLERFDADPGSDMRSSRRSISASEWLPYVTLACRLHALAQIWPYLGRQCNLAIRGDKRRPA